MFKWVRVVGKQYLGCWLIGVLLFAIQEIPYMIMPLLHLEPNPIMTMPTNSMVIDICQNILGVLCVVAMVLIVNKDNQLFAVKTKSEIIFFSLAVGVIALNFLGWILYFCGLQSVVVMIIFLFAMPPLYYLFIGLWRKNYFMVALSSMFFVVNLTNGLINLI